LECVILAKEFLQIALFLQALPRFRFCLGDANKISTAGGHDAMDRDNLNKDNNASSDRNPRSDHDRRSAHLERSEEEKFLHGKGRFKRPSEFAKSISAAGSDLVAASEMPANRTETRSGRERRSGQDRRCGFDTRSEVEQFLQGERRSGVDRRSRDDRRHRSFKKARAFARGLELKSEADWHDYANSDKRPADIPVAPHLVYANDGWAGWGDWLGVSAAATYFPQHRSFARARALLHGLRLTNTDKKPADSEK
jgi:hypothetical protein